MTKYIIALCIFLGWQSGHAKEAVKIIDLAVTENGFEPGEIKVKPGTHVVLNVTRKTDTTCATQIIVKEKNIKQELPLNKMVKVDLGVVKKGDVRFACSMDMISGHVIAE